MSEQQTILQATGDALHANDLPPADLGHTTHEITGRTNVLKSILIGVTGGIAVYKTCMIVSSLRQHGYQVFVVMTRAAQEFVTPKTFESLSGNPVGIDLFHSALVHPHIDLARQTSIFCIAPATANCLAKAASGIADDLLSTLMLSFEGMRLFAPAMNASMWRHPAVQRNLQQITSDSGVIIPPEAGHLACGETGEGRMASPETIVAEIEKWMAY